MDLKTLKFSIAVYGFLFLTVTAPLYAQTTAPKITASPTPSTVNEQRPSDEVIALRAQLETMRQYDQRLLATVYWSLGGMATVIIVIVGVGWYTNFRLYERDKSAMKQDLLLSLKEEIHKGIESAAEATASQSNRELKNLDRELKLTKYSLFELEANQHEVEGVYNNVLLSYLKMIKVSQEAGQDYFVSRTLGDVVRVLKILANEDVSRLDGQVAIDVTKILDSLGSEFSVDVDILRQLLRSARAK